MSRGNDWGQYVISRGSCEASANFSGTWAIDLKTSTSPDSLLKSLQTSFV